MKKQGLAVGLGIVFIAVPVLGQSGPPQEFPAGAVPAPAEVLKARLIDKVYRVRMHDGTVWRLEWKGNGYVYLNTDRGFSDVGKFRFEDGQFCVEMQRSGSACNEMRLAGDVLYYKRASNGEVVVLQQPN